MLAVIPGVWPPSLALRSEGAADVELQFLRSVSGGALGCLPEQSPLTALGLEGSGQPGCPLNITVSQKY